MKVKTQKPKTSKKKKPQKVLNRNPSPKKQASVAAAYATGNVGKAPKVIASRNQCRITHREFIGNVTGSVNFTNSTTYAVNPGIQETFPWLSIMAQGWEEYEFHRLRFCYYTRCSSATPGSFIMSPDYDSADNPPVNEQVMTSYTGAVEDAPWKDICCSLVPSLMNRTVKRHYVRTGPLAANLDIKTYDVANLFTATVDGSGSQAWGKLWVEYDITFYVPQLPSAGATQNIGGEVIAGGTLSAANPLGTAPTYSPGSVGLSADANSHVTLSKVGPYLAALGVNGSGMSGATLSSVSNCVITQINGLNTTTNTVNQYQILAQALPAVIALSLPGGTPSACGLNVATLPNPIL